ncbi:protein-L-isoaspartate O-methyltransferase family protein [Phytohabitans kaempferiae]|uniref:Protein-L-isoaspartate O-methyltransferase n=1 Tax=Phytohabitans kaempferiae TaxID=1620943 RepID=A0ABV6LX47_9ACTN
MVSSVERRRRFVDALCREGAITRPEVAAAFAAVPREAFVSEGFQGREGAWVTPDAEGFLDAVYTNDVLVTKVVGGRATSSSSQPSLMAAMIEALDLSPGTRVLEVGAGTGYNAALMSACGAQVTTVDVQPDVVERAAAGLRAAGVSDVDLQLGDGYAGCPAGGPYDRVVVTVGVAGAAPRWLDQLAPGGFVLVPVRHAGHHPVFRVARVGDGSVGAAAVCPAGFMPAAGPLSAPYLGAHPLGSGPLPEPVLSRPARFDPPLDAFRYQDMWFAFGAWDARTTYAQPPGAVHGGCALLDEAGTGGATIWPDGTVEGSGPHAEPYAERASALVDRWLASGRPTVPSWRARLALDGDPAQPIWVPREWHLAT